MDTSVLALLPPESVVFWSGAGISHDWPTNGLLGADLTMRTLEAYFGPSVYDDLQKQYRRLEVPHAEARPRLETVLDVAAGTYGVELLADAVGDLVVAPPNHHHRFFARHLAAGGSHITANFDTCIEKATAAAEVALRHRPLHFHGVLTDQPGASDLEALGARLSVIENGFPDDVARRLDEVLGRPEVRALVFVGYSGSDFFDVTPYLQERGLERLRGKLVAWVDRAPEPGPNRAGRDATAGYLPEAMAAGAAVVQFTGPLELLTAQLHRAWALPDVPEPEADPAPPWSPALAVSPELRLAATAMLYARMGFRQRTVETFGHKAALTPQEHELLADALWGIGRYRAAGEKWELGRAGDTPEAQGSRIERAVAVRWIRGQLVRAEREGWAAVQRFCHDSSGVSASTQLTLLETYLRVITHMRRLPDVRRRVDESRAQAAADLLTRLAGTVQGQEGIQLKARVGSVESTYRQ